MAGRRPGNNRRDEDEDDWAGFFGKLAIGFEAVAEAAAVGNALSRAFSQSLENANRQQSQVPGISYHYEEDSDEKIVIAIDATKTRGGGFLLFTRTKQIYFYSVDWSHKFCFPDEPDKFEMVNLALALEMFESKVAAYRRQDGFRENEDLTLKVDNQTIANSLGYSSRSANATYRIYLQQQQNKAESSPFNGTIKYASRVGDADMKIADKLSRSFSSSLPETMPEHSYTEANGYDFYNISLRGNSALDEIEADVPDEFKIKTRQEYYYYED